MPSTKTNKKKVVQTENGQSPSAPVTPAASEPPFDRALWLNALQDTVDRLLPQRTPLLLCSWQVLKPRRAFALQGRAYAPTERLLRRVDGLLVELQKQLEGKPLAASGLDLVRRCFLSRVQSGHATIIALLGDLAVTRDRSALVGWVTLVGMQLWLSVHLCLLWWRLGHLSKEFAYTRRQILQGWPPLPDHVPVTGGGTS